jgi:hypothetical protein
VNEDKPSLRVTGLFARGKPIPGLGAVPDLVDQAWGSDPGTEVVDRVFETQTAYLVAGLDRKEEATDEGFAEARDAIYRQLADTKSKRLVSHFAVRECLEAKGRGEIVPSVERITRLMVYDTKIGVDEKGERAMRPYSVCDRVGMRGGLLRTGLAAQQGGGAAQ